MNVLHVGGGNLFGGVETLLMTLARHRASAPGMEPAFALTHEGRLSEALRAAGVAPRVLGPVRFRQPWRVMGARRGLARLLRTERPDVVVCHAPWPHALFARVARRAGLPVVYWMHDRATGTHWTERIAARTPPDLAVVNSRFTAETLPRLFPGVPSELIYPPVEGPQGRDRAEDRAEVRCELGTAAETTVIIQSSRLELWKGQANLIAALARLRDRPGWEAWVAGGAQRPHEQRYLEELRDAARAAGIDDRVRFLGHRADVPRLLAAADIHCQPNAGPEPFGIAFVEALHAGLPVVSTRMGGAIEVISDDCGLLVPPGDTAALADALGSLIADPGLRARHGAAGPGRARALCDPAARLGHLAGLLAGLVAARAPVG